MTRKLLKILTVLSTFIYATNIVGQTDSSSTKDSTAIVVITETLPEFPGGTQQIYKIIKDNLKYPETALKDGVGGRVVVQFVVDTVGNVVEEKVVKGIREDLDAEAIRLIRLLNGWTPGMQSGKKVRVIYNLPLTFSVYENKSKKRKWRN